MTTSIKDIDTIVLGAGIIGVNTAYWLSRLGQTVLVVDRQPGPGLETSFANGGQISVSHAEPWANPAAPLKVLKWLARKDAPLLYRPRLDPYQWWWLLQWLLECLPNRTRGNIIKIVNLATYSRSQLQEVREREGIRYDQRSLGILHFYRDLREFENAVEVAEFMQRYGCRRQVVGIHRILAIEPALAHAAGDIVGGTYTERDESGDAHLFTRELAGVCARRGVAFLYRTELVGFRHDRPSRAISGVVVKDTVSGRTRIISGKNYVAALGSYSAPLLRKIGLYLNIYPAKGYSITVPVSGAAAAPRVSLTDDQYKLVYSRLGDRLRVAGTAELSGYGTAIDPVRCRAIVENARRVFPAAGDYDRAVFWTGLRPATPSNVPYIGQSDYRNLWLNTGHGTLGWTMGCGSGRIIAEQIIRSHLK
ncbi:MAG: D-amino acid dehydrogenase [Thermodesulfobacteriota bacterium]